MIANGTSTVFLAPGECNNTNGVFQISIDQAVILGVNTLDADGVSRTQDWIDSVGKNLTCISRDPGPRGGTYAFMKILGIAGFIPVGPIANILI